MVLSKNEKMLHLHLYTVISLCICINLNSLVYADDNVQFNTDILDVQDRENIDLSQFSRSEYIMPGAYTMVTYINDDELDEEDVDFYQSENGAKESSPCISKKITMMLGLKTEYLKKLTWWHQGQCLNIESLNGVKVRSELASSSLYLNIPQIYLEYRTKDWDPPSRWDDGIPGVIFDYNFNAQTQFENIKKPNTNNISANGTTGVNLDAWRLRADWQGIINHNSNNENDSQRFDWSRFYIYRPLHNLRALLTMGEDYLDSAVFDSFRYTGLSLRSDDKMLPPNLRGYAPEINGIAKTNAKVTVSQQGRVIYETQVPSGPFRIQDINETVSGELDVRVEEQNGSVQKFKINTADVPYLTRPGQIRYKFAAGKPSDWQHHTIGSMFGSGEFSWGMNNGWSLYGGLLAGDDYNSISIGVGRDLMVIGALSFDITQSYAVLPYQNSSLTGDSYRLSYSKTFDEIDSKVTFAGYRFSDDNFMSMSDYINAKIYNERTGSSKEMYTVIFNKQFRDIGLSSYLNISHQSYWNRSANDRYSLSVSRYLDFGNLKSLSVSFSGYRNRYNKITDDGMYLSFSMPWGNSSNISYNMDSTRHDMSNKVTYYDNVDEHNNYQLSTGKSNSGVNLNGYLTHQGDIGEVSANASYQEGSYSALGFSAQGGITLTTQGGALHRSAEPGGTRLLLDTDGVAGVPVRGYGSTTKSNYFGKAVVTDVNSYYRSQASIDIDQLSDNAEATKSVVQATLTDGAIGYRRFNVISGGKAMATIKLVDGSSPPFGATIVNDQKQETGIVSDGGTVYLSGIRPGEEMIVKWNNKEQCVFSLPHELPKNSYNNMLLPCESNSNNM